MSKRRRRRSRPFSEMQDLSVEMKPASASMPDRRPVRISVMAYNGEKLIEQEISQPEDIKGFIGKWSVLWVNVDGLSDVQTIRKLGDIFLLHELAIEDVVNMRQRAKVERYGDHLFIVLRSVAMHQEAIVSEQVSIFAAKSFAVTFQEDGRDCLASVKERVRKGFGQLRNEAADYLVYAIVDSIVDDYFPVVESLGDELEGLEDEILDRADKHTPARVHEIKRKILTVKRAVWPAREAISTLTREDTSDVMGEKARLYMRDCYDHTIRIIDLIETQREMSSDLMDLYLSSVSNRMNQVIKVLTIVTLLFMPPTLVAGIYGMNFRFVPEFQWKYGYYYALALMVLTAGFVWFWSWRSGWLDGDAAKETHS